MRARGQVKNEDLGREERFSLERSPDTSGNQTRVDQTKRTEAEECRLLGEHSKQTWPRDKVTQVGIPAL